MRLPFRRLDRYVLSETLGPLTLGFVVYTFIMLVRFLFRSADMIIRRGLAASDVLELVWLTLPNICVLTIPMSLLFGVLIAVGRLSSDSELTAMRASGISLFSLYRPVLVLSILLTGINTYLAAYVLPRANAELQGRQLEIAAQTANKQVEPRVFYEDWEGFVLYVFDVLERSRDTWEGVFLAPSIQAGENVVTVASAGGLAIDEEGERIVLGLRDAVIHKVDLEDPRQYETIRQARLSTILEDQFLSSQRMEARRSRGVRELTLSELGDWIADEELPADVRRLARVEVHKKFSIPAACLVFGLFAVPLGFNNRRGGKSSGFAISILVILAYYVLMSNGEEAARVGKMPSWLAMWLPNLVFTGLGLFLLGRKNQDKSLLFSRVDRWRRTVASKAVAEVKHQRQQRRTERRERQTLRDGRRAPDVVLRIPRWSVRFPGLIDRYVLTLFGKVFFLVVLSGLSLFIVADLTDNLDDILDHRPPTGVVVAYYAYLSLQLFFEIAPILVLVTTLLTFTLLARTNEVTAAKALGVSLYRLSLPALAGAALVAGISVLLQAEVLPASNQEVARLKDEMKGRATARTYGRSDRQWLFGTGPYIFNYTFFDPVEQRLDDLQVFEFGPDRHVRRRVWVDQARWVDGRWVFERGWARSFQEGALDTFFTFETPRLGPYPEPPEYFASEDKRPEQMAFDELRDHIEELEQRGRPMPELRVELYNKVAFPALSLVMGLVALPFAFRLGRRGALYGVGISLVLGMVLLGVFAFFSTLGEAGALPPTVAVSAPSLLFGTLSLYLFLGIRS